MRTIEGERFILDIECKDNERFSVFGVSDILYYNATLREQTLELFEHTPTSQGNKFNSGERKLDIEINSEEERYELSYLFIKAGFKIRQPEELYLNLGCYWYRRLYFTQDYNFKTGFGARVYSHMNHFTLYLRKKDVSKFLLFLKILSRDYGYKTTYEDIYQSRNACMCCTESDYNYKKRVKLI
jgi:hypothetical protein